MFNGLGSLSTLMKGASELRTQMGQIDQQLRQERVEGSSGGGMVTVEMNGAQEVVRCRIDPSLLSEPDQEMIEELVMTAVNQATEKSRQLSSETFNEVLGGLNIPGVKEAMQRFTNFRPPST